MRHRKDPRIDTPVSRWAPALAGLLGLALLAAPGSATPGHRATLRVSGAHHALVLQEAPAQVPPRVRPAAAPLAERIADAYHQLELLTSTSADPVHLSIGEVSEGRTADVATRRLADLVTADASQAANVAREETRDPAGRAVRYTLHWSPLNVNPAALPGGSLADLWESEQRLRLERAAPPKAAALPGAEQAPSPEALPGAAPVPLSRFDRYARFRVTVAAHHLGFAYWALVLRRSATGETLFIDPVLWMVNSADAEGLPPARSAPGAFRDYLMKAARAADVTDTSCTYQNFGQSSVPDDPPYQEDRTDHHDIGKHSVDTYANYMCECEPDCTSICTPVVSASAVETPDVIPFNQDISHRASSSSSNGQLGTGMPGAGASCDAWAGACVKRCLFGMFCDVQIGYAGVSVTLPNDCLIQSSAKVHGSCPACSPPPPPNPPPSGGGPNTGGGGGPCAYGDEVTPEECVDSCGGVVDGDYCDVPY